MNDIKWLLYILYLKSVKITLSVCAAVGKFVRDTMVESLSALRCICMFKIARLLNRSWFILERSHVFSLRGVEKAPAALVAGFTRICLLQFFGLGSYLVLTDDLVKTPSFSRTCTISIWTVSIEMFTSSLYSFTINFSSSGLSRELRAVLIKISSPFVYVLKVG